MNNKKSKKRLLDSKNQNESDDEDVNMNNSENKRNSHDGQTLVNTIRNNNEINENHNQMDLSLTNGYKQITSPKLSNFTTTFNLQQQQQQFIPNSFNNHRSPLLNNSNSIHALQTPTPAPTPPTNSIIIDSDGLEIPVGNPIDWNCDQVYGFVKAIAGPNVAHTFKLQEVDGSALTLIKDDHLVNTMQIKLGPALKILNKFNEIRAKFK